MLKSSCFSILLLALSFSYCCYAQDQACTVYTNSQGIETNDCAALNSCIEGLCVHKDIFPLTLREGIGAIFIMIFSGFANAGGIGGGGFLSPLLLLLFGYNTTKTVMLVYVLIFGGSLGNLLNVAFERDVFTGKPLVLYDLALIVTPAMLIGSNVGVVLNKAFPPVLTIGALIYLASTAARKMFREAKLNYARENEILSNPLLLNERDQLVQENKSTKEAVELLPLNQGDQTTNTDGARVPYELEKIIKEENSFLPFSKIAVLLSLLAYIIIVTILRGTEKFDSIIGVEYCSFGYWLWFLVGLAGCFAFFLYGTKMVKQTIEIKKKHKYTKSTFTLTNEDVKLLGYKGVVAGCLAGLIGIGGGFLLSSILIGMGVKPQSMTATLGFFVVLVALISLFQAFLYGGITPNELVFFFLVSSVGSYTVSRGLTYLVKKYKRPSILLIVLCVMLCAASTILPLFTIYKSIQNPWQMIAVRSIC